jgi:ribosomal protein L23
MALELKPGKTVQVTVSKQITRAAARKTLERIFMQDKAVVAPLEARSANFKDQPKRRGGCIWTKRANKIHCELNRGASATIVATPQSIRDLNSVASFIEVKSA